ncbi:MAG: hypothetical protein K2K57_09150 [Oscillospiraceae bacterium]|nr:hypothetical protein [Oscillospiraceae bacterium]
MTELRNFFVYNMVDFHEYMKSHYKTDEYFEDFLNRLNKYNAEFGLGELMSDTKLRYYSAPYNSEKYNIIKSSVKAAAEKYLIKISEHTYSLKCTKKEIDTARFYKMKLGIYGSEDHTEHYKTKYSDKYCSACDTHQRIPAEKVFINKCEFRGKDISCSDNLNNEILLSDKIKNLIEENNLTGVEFYPAHHYSKMIKNDYPVWRMAVTSILPPVDKSMDTEIIEGYCDVCKCHHILPLSYLRYKNSDLQQAADFNLSREHFGAGWYGSPELIVSRRVYNIFKGNNVKGVKYEIVGMI